MEFRAKKDKSAARFSHQVAAWAPSYVLQLLFNEKSKIVNHSAATEAREKISTYLEFVEY